MEIYKVASQAVQTQAVQQDMGTNTPRAIEQAKINSDVADSKSALNDAQEALSPQEQKNRLDDAINELNKNMEKLQTNLRFGYYDPLNTMTVSVINTKNGDTIRQYPSEQVLSMREKFAEAIGLLFDQKG